MKRFIFSLLALVLFGSILYAQEDREVEVKTEKKIIIKTIDDEGNVTTKIIEGDDVKDYESNDNITITEEGDSIRVEIEMEEGDGKRIKKHIVIPGMEDLDDIEKDIRIYEFDDDFAPKLHGFWMDDLRGPHPLPDGMQFYFDEGGPDKAQLGVTIEDVDDGVKVTEVMENSSAWSVGILAGDVITHIDGKKMTNVEELQREVTDHEPGDMIDIRLKRNGKTEKFTARLQNAKSQSRFVMPPAFDDGMHRLKHHFYRGIDEFENQRERKHDCQPKYDDEKRIQRKKEIIIDKEIKLEEKKKELEKEKEILEREIEEIEKENK